jgi:hypothetical protein
MQTLNSLYGLYVDCKNSEHEAYINLKGILEKVFNELQHQAISKNHQGIIAHSIALGNGNQLSFCFNGKNLEVGIVNTIHNSIKRNCDFSLLSNIDERAVSKIAIRGENLLSNPQAFLNNTALKDMWKKELVKTLDNSEKKSIFTSSLDESIKVATARSNDIRTPNAITKNNHSEIEI